jgi:hypothetical protein
MSRAHYSVLSGSLLILLLLPAVCQAQLIQLEPPPEPLPHGHPAVKWVAVVLATVFTALAYVGWKVATRKDEGIESCFTGRVGFGAALVFGLLALGAWTEVARGFLSLHP